MLKKEPFRFPARQRFTYDPGVSDRQLWAIGMVIVQWSMTEWFIDMHIRKLMEGDDSLVVDYKKIRNLQQTLAFWETLLELRGEEPLKSERRELIQCVKNLSSQRDEVVHRMWGGGMEGNSWSAAGLETTDAGLMANPGEKIKTKSDEGPIPFTWKATFPRLKRLATDISELNRDLLVATMILPSAPLEIDGSNHAEA